VCVCVWKGSFSLLNFWLGGSRGSKSRYGVTGIIGEDGFGLVGLHFYVVQTQLCCADNAGLRLSDERTTTVRGNCSRKLKADYGR